MEILLELFITFFKIGLFTIGGGYAMIPMIKSEVVSKGWITAQEVIDFIAISESTPGPFAINIATFIGETRYGILGAAVATLGVVLPSFIIILIVSHFVNKFLTNKYINYALDGVKPVVIGLILSVALVLIYDGIFKGGFNLVGIDYKALIIMVTTFILLRFKKTKNPIFLIVVSAILGILLYSW
jgi:chromate transporter